MNFFFGIKSLKLSSNLTIPKFQNFSKTENQIKLYEAYPKDNKWEINKLNCDENENFFFVNNQIENDKFFFLAYENQINNYKKKNFYELTNLNNFTDTAPAFRANLKILLSKGGYSSYQSEYPYEMIKKKGNILSPINILLNRNSDYNFIFFKNIYYKPIKEKSYLYIIDFKSKKIIEKFEIFSNYLNEILVKDEYLNGETYIFSENCLGIPLFVSIKDSHISFEHTHPPHHYILSEDKYKTVSMIKNEFKKIISR